MQKKYPARHSPATRHKEKRQPAATFLTLAGTSIHLTRPLRRADFGRPSPEIRYWIDAVPFFSNHAPFSEKRLNGWLLVLSAKLVPHILIPGRPSRIYLPPLYMLFAKQEIAAFEAEKNITITPVSSPHSYLILVCFFLFLAYWHSVKEGWFPAPFFLAQATPPLVDWNARYGLDAYRVAVLHEWWRSTTALFLHADTKHLFANLGIGVLFFTPLYRRLGSGLAFALPILAGSFGNAMTALYHPPYVLSLGFSTALFSGVGLLVAFSTYDCRQQGASFSLQSLKYYRQPLKHLAAGLAILGLWGSGGGEISGTVDYPAHCFGMLAGLIIGILCLPLDAFLRTLSLPKQYLVQAILILATILFVAWTWTKGGAV